MVELELHFKYLLNFFLTQLQKNKKRTQDETENGQTEGSQEEYEEEEEEVMKWYKRKSQESVTMNGIYWVLSGITLITGTSIQEMNNDQETEDSGFEFRPHNLCFTVAEEIYPYQEKIIRIIESCYDSTVGGYKSHMDYPDSIISTMSAIQCLLLLNKKSLINRSDIIKYVQSLQDPITGSFLSSKSPVFSSVDLRFTLCALVILYHLGCSLDSKSVNQDPVLNFSSLISGILACQNYDGGFGSSINNESHGGYTYCAVASLALLHQLDRLLDNQALMRLCRFLKSRVVHNSDDISLNGRAGKSSDVCYAWWIGTTMHIIDKYFHTHLVCDANQSLRSHLNKQQTIIPQPSEFIDQLHSHDDLQDLPLAQWILTCQNPHIGGFSPRPFHSNTINILPLDSNSDSSPDPFHTFFSLASLSLMTTKSKLHFTVDPLTAFPCPY